MGVAIVTGSAGLIGSEAVQFFAKQGLDIAGIDNDMRRVFFGEEASTSWRRRELERSIPAYRHYATDIRDKDGIESIFRRYGKSTKLVLHAAAQPSHDWAAREPHTDFDVNAVGTLNVLEAARQFCPGAVFIFTSTNKVYGDTPNSLPLVEMETRWELPSSHPWGRHGIDETMSTDRTLHSLFGASKVAADVMVQEYGRYFGINTVCFRGGCLTGPGHSGAALHGFLAYLVKCVAANRPYTVLGYKGKQVRDNIHAFDMVSAMWEFFRNPQPGKVYNMGGGRQANCSVLEALKICEKLVGRPAKWTYVEGNRRGDHIWWISDTRAFKNAYPAWRQKYDLETTIREIYESVVDRVASPA
jgi:CDP-paratose 2-epimerase